MSEPTHPAAEGPNYGTCPICRRPADPVLRPFCSKRCSDVDLHRWLAGSYRIPVEDEPDDLGDGSADTGGHPE